MSTKLCDHIVVGNIIKGTGRPGCGPKGQCLISKRRKRPKGWSPVTGHKDDHGTVLSALAAETREETGLVIMDYRLIIENVWRPSACPRISQRLSPGHTWTIWETECYGDPTEAPDENLDLTWVSAEHLALLAKATYAYACGYLTHGEWDEDPGMEPIWVRPYVLAGVFEMAETQLRKIDQLCLTIPVKDYA